MAAERSRLTPSRMQALDGMRGIAAMTVLLDHVGLLTAFPQLAEHGAIAVDLFFMISGFVMANAYEPRFALGMTTGDFAGKRLLRLYPAIALGLVLSLIIALAMPTIGPDASGATWLLHALVLPNLRGGYTFPINPVLWSLFFELAANLAHARFYGWLTTPRLVAAVGVAGAAFVLAAIHMGGAGVGAEAASFAAGFARVAWGYGAGILIYRLIQLGVLRQGICSAGPVLFVATAMLLLPPIAGKLRIAVPLFVGFPLVVLLGALARPIKGVVGRLADWLGDISYPLYTTHWPLLLAATGLIGVEASFAAWWGVLAMIVGVASVAEYGFDAPVRRWLKRRTTQGAPAR